MRFTEQKRLSRLSRTTESGRLTRLTVFGTLSGPGRERSGESPAPRNKSKGDVKMYRCARLAVAALLTFLCLFSVTSHAGFATPKLAFASSARLTPCPGPYAYEHFLKGQGTVVGADGSVSDKSSVSPQGLNTRCVPPPSAPFPSPILCGLRFTGYAAPYSVITCNRLPPSLCGTSATNGTDIIGTGLNLTAPGYHIYELVGTGFIEVSAVTGQGGEYEFLQSGQPTFTTGTAADCIPIIPLPHTGAGEPPWPVPLPAGGSPDSIVLMLCLAMIAVCSATLVGARKFLKP